MGKSLHHIGIAAALLVAGFVGNASAEVVFRGYMVVTKAQKCEFTEAGRTFLSQFHPNGPNKPDNNFSGLTHLYQFGGAGYSRGGAFTSKFKNVEGTGLGWGGFTFEGAKVRITKQTPANITNKTRFVTLKGQVQKFDSDPGVGGDPCIVTFEAAYGRDPNS